MSKVLRTILWPVSRTLAWAWGLLLGVLRRAMSHGVTGTASQFAFNTFLATVPFVFVVVTAVKLSSPTAYDELFDALEGTIPGITQLTDTFQSSPVNGTTAGVLILAGVIVGLYMASNAIGALVDGLDRALHLNHRPWWRGKVLNFGFALGASVLAAASTLALAGGPDLVRGLARLLGASRFVRGLADSLTFPVGVFTLMLFTVLVYRLGPNGMRMGYRTLLPGVVLSVAGTFGLTKLIGLYADVFDDLEAVYGTLGSLFVYLTFLYFTGLLFLTGAELNAELLHRRLVRASTKDAAARTTEGAAGDAGAPAADTTVGPLGPHVPTTPIVDVEPR